MTLPNASGPALHTYQIPPPSFGVNGTANLTGVHSTLNGTFFVFRFYEQTITSILPRGGPSEGANFTVTLGGQGFGGMQDPALAQCKFGAHVAAVLRIDDGGLSASCAAPALRLAQGSVVEAEVTLALNGMHFVSSVPASRYLFYAQEVHDIRPTGGPVQGATVITVSGFGFNAMQDGGASTRCKFGTAEAPIDSQPVHDPLYTPSPSMPRRWTVRCVAPPASSADSSAFSLALNARHFVTSAAGLRFIYFRDPHVFGILPTGGPVGGGTLVTVLGRGFMGLEGDMATAKCRFGGLSKWGTVVHIAPTGDELHCRSPTPDFAEVGCMLPPMPPPPSAPPSQPPPLLPPRLPPHSPPNENATAFAANASNVTNASAPLPLNATFGNASNATVVVSAPPAPPGTPGDPLVAPSPSDGGGDEEAAYVVPCQREAYTVAVALDGQIAANTFGAVAPAYFDTLTNETAPAAANGSNVSAQADGGPCHFGRCREFVFYREPTLDEVGPRGGPTRGGFTVMALGSYLDGMQLNASIARCAFGGFSVPVHAIVDGRRINCTTPPHVMAEVPFRLSLNGWDFAPSSHTYRFYPQRVTAVWPLAGAIGGGTRVTIVGEGFDTFEAAAGSALCRFVSHAHRSVCEYFDATSLRVATHAACLGTTELQVGSHGRVLVCTAPPAPLGAAGPMKVQLALNGVDFLELDEEPATRLVYYDEPRVHSFVPRIGSVTSRTPVTVFGEGLDVLPHASAACHFGSQRSSMARVLNSTTASCDAPVWDSSCPSPPPRVPGSVSVGLALNGADAHVAWGLLPAADTSNNTNRTATNASAAHLDDEDDADAGRRVARRFSLYPAPRVTGVQPDGGTLEGGVTVTVHGSGFLEGVDGDLALVDRSDALCRFGGEGGAVSSGTPLNDTVFLCAVPRWPFAPGQAPVEVSLNGRDFAGRLPDPLLFGFVRLPVVSAAFPLGGPVAGGTRLRLGGSGFDVLDARQDARCLFGSETLTAATVRSGRVAECISPPSSGAGLVALKLTLNGEEFATIAGGRFAYYVQPALAQLQPPAGPALGGRLVTIAALGLDAFGETKDARCNFGDVSSVARIKTASALVCAAPPHPAGTVNVTVSLNGAEYTSEHLAFQYKCSGYTLIQDCVLDSSCGFCGLEHAGRCLPCADRDRCEDGAAEPCEAEWSYARELRLQQFTPLESNGSVEVDAFHFLRLRCVRVAPRP